LKVQENNLLLKLQDLSTARDWMGLMALTDQAIQMARMEEGVHPTNAGAIYYNLALAHENLRNFDEAIRFHEQDLGVAKCVGDLVWIAQAVRNIANVKVPWASQKRSVEDFERMKQAKGIENFSASNIVEYAICLRDEGLHQCVIETLEPHPDIVRNAGDREQEGIACGALSGAYLSRQHYNKAIKVSDRRLLIAKETGDRHGESVALCHLGSSYTNLGQYEKALKYLEQDLIIARELGDLAGEAFSLGNMGNTLFAQGYTAMAAERFLASQRCAEEAGDHDSALKASMLRGRALCNPSTWAECAMTFADCISVADRLGDKKAMGEACGWLGHMYLEYYCVKTGGRTICDERGLDDSLRTDRVDGVLEIKAMLRLAQHWSVAAFALQNYDSSVALDLARQEYLLGEDEDSAISMLQLYLKHCVSRGRHADKNLHVCDFCSQTRGDDAPMKKCGDCYVARYCSREHQKLAHKNGTGSSRGDFPHKIVCPLWKRWRSVEEGEESAEDCRQDFLEFLAKINTLTSDGKMRDVGGGDGGEESVPPMIMPNAQNLPVPFLLTSSVGERV